MRETALAYAAQVFVLINGKAEMSDADGLTEQEVDNPVRSGVGPRHPVRCRAPAGAFPGKRLVRPHTPAPDNGDRNRELSSALPRLDKQQ